MSSSSPSIDDRRQHRRIETLGRIQGRLLPTEVAVTILELSVGGFSFQSPLRLSEGSVRNFRLSQYQSDSLTIAARVVHNVRSGDSEGQKYYVSGVQFVMDQSPSTVRVIEGLAAGLQGG